MKNIWNPLVFHRSLNNYCLIKYHLQIPGQPFMKNMKNTIIDKDLSIEGNLKNSIGMEF